jgi:hypothetical protein
MNVRTTRNSSSAMKIDFVHSHIHRPTEGPERAARRE